MFDFEVAFYLYKISKIYDVFIGSKYKSRAYYNAAMAIDAYNCYVKEIYRENRLRDIPYIGKTIEQCIIQIMETDRLDILLALEEEYGIRDYDILLSHGLSSKIIKELYAQSIQTFTELEQRSEFVNSLFSEKEKKKIQIFMEENKYIQKQYLFAYGDCLGNELKDILEGIAGVEKVCFIGEMINQPEKISKIEFAVEYVGRWEYFIKKVKQISRIHHVVGREHEYINAVTAFGIPVQIIVNVKFHAESENGIALSEVRGDLHSHTSWTDGIHSLEEMADEAVRLGRQYHAITDHSISMRIANGLSDMQALSQIQQIREYNKTHEIKILAGIEVDILSDGELDYSNEILKQFDFVVAAVHSNIQQSASDMERRLEKALANPYINILAHPTGRLLGRPGVLFSERGSVSLSVERIINICQKNNVALEINCFPERMDLNVKNVKLAIKKGVKLSLGSDAHSSAHLINIKYGLRILNLAKAQRSDILNLLEYNDLIDFFQEKRKTDFCNMPCKNEFEEKSIIKGFNYFFNKNEDIIKGRVAVIGIDLTGSEQKESGWAYLKGNHVVTKRILLDQDIIQSIHEMQPAVVSIDSPLAYPKGRCCAKKDCKCSKYGIMRECERNLRHFGLTVYPCLIDSMVALTTRGKNLANILRKMGYCVIESYPGAAQDILQIPRKGKTKEQFAHLKQGLINFGIKGDLGDNVLISHDEVDAITSALVGYFYLNEQYVALGNREEDYLIVPRIRQAVEGKGIVLGLCGETGTGKSVMAEYLRFKYGFEVLRYSQIIKEKYGSEGKHDLQRIGNEISADEEKQRGLTREMVKRMQDNQNYVIDGLRHMEDLEECRRWFGDAFTFIYIDTSYANRFKRYNKLHFNEISEREFYDINNHPSERDIVILRYYNDYLINNNKGFKDYRKEIDAIIKRLGGIK